MLRRARLGRRRPVAPARAAPGLVNPTRAAWLAVALLLPVALLNYLDRQMLASMKFSVMADIPTIATEANWGRMLGQFKWVYAFLSPVGGYLADRFGRRHTDLRQPLRLVGGDLGDRTRHLLRRPAAHPFADGHQRGLLHPRRARPDRGLSPRAHPLSRGRPAPDGHLLRRHRGRLRRLRGGQPGPGLALGLRRLRRRRHGLRPAPRAPAARRAGSATATSAPARPVVRTARELLTNRSFILLVLYFTLPALAGWVVRDWMPAILKQQFGIGQGEAGVSATLYWQVAAIVGALLGASGRPLDAAPRARPHLHERPRHEPHRPRDVRRGQRRYAGRGGGLPRPVRARLGLLRLQQHAHPLPGGAAHAARHRVRRHEPGEHQLRGPGRLGLRRAARRAGADRRDLRRLLRRGGRLRRPGPPDPAPAGPRGERRARRNATIFMCRS